SSWAARNANRPALTPRGPLNAAQKAQANTRKASHKLSAEQCKEADDGLSSAIQCLLADKTEKINAIALEHGVTQEKVKKLMGGEKHYKGNCNVQLANALIHAKAQEVNADRPRGAKLSLKEIRNLVKADDSMRNLTAEEEQEYINKLNEHCALQNMSVRATNTAVARDVHWMVLDGLAVQTGIYACLFTSRGHVYDTTQATWFGTDNVMDFWEDVLQIMQRVCTRLLNSGLSTFLFKFSLDAVLTGISIGTTVKRRDIQINYTNFSTAIKEKLGIDLRGWPDGIPFQSPTSINDHNALLKLRNALKDGSCHWFRMTPRQREEHSAQLAARRKRGETVGKPRKKRSDAGVPHK
ncbi:hypothetical protein P692DRAFT_201672374, partial [Suillus brevipes Sb2]